jgi:uncharacterized protein (TIGR02246 family)
MKVILIFIYLAVTVSAFGDDSVTFDKARDAREIRALNQDWIDVSAAGDVDAYMDFVADDFIWLGSLRGDGFRGEEELRSFLEPFFANSIFSIVDVSPVEIVFSESGKQAVHVYEAVAVVEAKDGGAKSADRRRYFDMWIKVDDRWLCSRHLFIVLES